MANSAETPKLQLVKLRGFERMTTMVDGVSMKIVHSMLVEGDVAALLRYLPTALTRTFNTHPRMRALQFSPTSEESSDDWQQYAKDECNVGFDRYTQFPFFLTVWVNTKADLARLMLFSDHYMSDGYSGMAVLHCILEQVTLLAAQGIQSESESNPVEEFPLRPSFYDMWLSKKPLSKGLLKGVISMLGKAIYRSEMKKITPVLPARADQQDFVAPPVMNPTYASFAQGDPHSMSKALSKCKGEDVTFGGAVVCATLLAFYHAAKELPIFDPTQPFKFMAGLDYNMRHRVPHPVDEDPVGAYVAFADLGWLATEGVDLKTTRFWELARRAKLEIDGNVRQTTMMAAVPIILDQRINPKVQPSFAKALNIRHSQTSDANLSNVGRYSYAKEYSLLQSGYDGEKKSALRVRSLHVYNPIPHLGPSAVLFVSSVDSFCYSMGHKCEDSAAKVLLTAWVAICENIGNVGGDETLEDVLKNLK